LTAGVAVFGGCAIKQEAAHPNAASRIRTFLCILTA
jgi:hypothetical protein